LQKQLLWLSVSALNWILQHPLKSKRRNRTYAQVGSPGPDRGDECAHAGDFARHIFFVAKKVE
jgi:hypothetical protein